MVFNRLLVPLGLGVLLFLAILFWASPTGPAEWGSQTRGADEPRRREQWADGGQQPEEPDPSEDATDSVAASALADAAQAIKRAQDVLSRTFPVAPPKTPKVDAGWEEPPRQRPPKPAPLPPRDPKKSVQKRQLNFCIDLVGKVVRDEPMTPSPTCDADLTSIYTNCSVLGAGHFSMGVKCSTSSQRDVVVKLAFIKDKPPADVVRNSVKEAVVGCQVSLLKSYGVLDTYADLWEYMWCAAGRGKEFVNSFALPRNPSISFRDVKKLIAFAAKGQSTLLVLSAVQVPTSTAQQNLEQFEASIGLSMVYELVYSIIAFHYVTDFCTTDLRLHHLGWEDVRYSRQYDVGGATVVIPAGKMLKIIDLGSTMTAHKNKRTAKGVLRTSFYLSSWARESKKKQFDQQARELYEWSSDENLLRLPPLEYLEKFTAHTAETYPDFMADKEARQKLSRAGHLRRYTLPNLQERDRLATTFGNLTDFAWRELKVERQSKKLQAEGEGGKDPDQAG